MLTRRAVLRAAGAAATGLASAAVVAGCTGDPDPMPAPTFNPRDWDSVRGQFELDPALAHFAAFVFASHPAPVRAAIDRFRSELDRDPYGYLGRAEAGNDDAVLAAAARYLDTAADQIALTDSTTMGLGLLYAGLRLRPGDEILTTEHDFYSTHESLRLRAVRDGATVRRVRLYDEPARADADDMVGRLRAAVTPATRIVAVTWVHSSTGVKLPVRRISDALAELNRDRAEADRALLCVDGVHGFGAEGVPPGQLGCDFLVSGCHKWLFGPRGTGFVWGRAEAWNRYAPVIPSFSVDGIDGWLSGRAPSGPPGPLATPGGYHSFEHRWALAPAFDLHAAIGPARVADRTHQLATALKDGLAALPRVTLHTPRSTDLSAGVVTCEIAGVAPRAAVGRLTELKVSASVTPYATPYLRLGTSILVSEADVDRALSAVRQL